MDKIIGFLNLYDSPELGSLTEKRTLGSTSFLGRYALMDFALSNFSNSDIDNFSILLKDNFRSVTKHVNTMKAWVNNTKSGKQFILLNEKGIKEPSYNTDLNNLKENDWLLYELNYDYVIIQPAHILTFLDYRLVVQEHKNNKADITIVYKKIDDANKEFINSTTIVIDDGLATSYGLNKGDVKKANVSLNSYIFSKDVLKKILNARGNNKCISFDEAIKKAIGDKNIKVYGYEYKGYARCFDSLKHLVDYSFELLDYDKAREIFDNEWTTYTVTHDTPPSLYGPSSHVKNSYIANGTKIFGTVENSIISRYVTIGENAVVKNSIILTATKISENAIIENAVIDKYAQIGENAKIKGTKTNPIYIKQGKVIK